MAGQRPIERCGAGSSSPPQLNLFGDAGPVKPVWPGADQTSPDAQSQVNPSSSTADLGAVVQDLLAFREFGSRTKVIETRATTWDGEQLRVPTYVNEYWTKKQRAAHSLHEISYHACFKPQLPRFAIQRLTRPGDIVYDPFMGRGTTLLEAALLGRVPMGCDINPLSVLLCRPRFSPPTIATVARRLAEIDFRDADEMPEDLLVFFHPQTLREVCALRKYLLSRRANSQLDSVDEWIWMVSLHTLSGHSRGFFSGYTMPPNVAVLVARQRELNQKRGLTPPRKHVAMIVARKTGKLLSDCDARTRCVLAEIKSPVRLLTRPAADTPDIPTASVALVATSPPFLDVIDYKADNWLRCWFAGVDVQNVKMTVTRRLKDWQEAMSAVFRELHRVLRPGGWVAFEVGEVHGGKIKLEESVIPCGVAAGLRAELVLIHDQSFSKTSHCWGQQNNVKGTNTNRIVLFRKS